MDIRFQPASPNALNQLRSLGAPESVVAFYAEYEPEDMMEGSVRLTSIEGMMIENQQAVPGYRVQPHGYIVFATSDCGDGYCFDTNRIDAEGRPCIVIASHETAEDIETAEQAAAMVQMVAPHLLSFLERMLDGNMAVYDYEKT